MTPKLNTLVKCLLSTTAVTLCAGMATLPAMAAAASPPVTADVTSVHGLVYTGPATVLGERDPFAAGARTGERDPFTQGARSGERNPFTDGAHASVDVHSNGGMQQMGEMKVARISNRDGYTSDEPSPNA